MPSTEPKVGSRYLTVAGAPVLLVEVRDGIMMLQGLASDNRFAVPARYPLQPFTGQDAAFQARSGHYSGPYVKPRLGRPLPKALAPIIDAMLLSGGKTMRGMVRELRRRASTSCRGRDLEANIRARTYWLRKAGKVVGWVPKAVTRTNDEKSGERRPQGWSLRRRPRDPGPTSVSSQSIVDPR